jgi:tRNA threonylcarbamoyladenosine dehydratase
MSSEDKRFGGIVRLYGKTALAKFQSAHVVVVGIGGVGSWVAEALARSAIGKITLVDLDDVCVSNINRQLVALSSSVSESKVEVMANRIKDINPGCTVVEIEDFVTMDNFVSLLADDVDYVVDAIDNPKIKAMMIAHCKRIKLPILTMGGAGGQLDPTLVTLRDLSRTENDPLAGRVRKELRKKYNFPEFKKQKFKVDCVFSMEQATYPSSNGETCNVKPNAEKGDSVKLDCASGFGAVTHVTATFGMVAVAKVLEKLK